MKNTKEIKNLAELALTKVETSNVKGGERSRKHLGGTAKRRERHHKVL